MDIASIHNLFLQCDSVSIDTRKILPNSLFVAIKGENFDANTFAKEALKNYKASIDTSAESDIEIWIDSTFEDFKNEIEKDD